VAQVAIYPGLTLPFNSACDTAAMDEVEGGVDIII
jgi:hypothetical protein